ncbi:MAG TPA: hypothetical protein VK176_03980 [Phycisphaerales bacterium]|nr:hypothetical protein [Phycisphaerales bacterium]
MRHIAYVLYLLAALTMLWMVPGARGQTQEEAELAVAKAQEYVTASSGAVRFERSTTNPKLWSVSVAGQVGATNVNYSGVATVTQTGTTNTVTFSPALWVSPSANSDALKASVQAVAAAAAASERSVTVFEYDLSSPMTRPNGGAPGADEPLGLAPMTAVSTISGIPSVRQVGGGMLDLVQSTAYLMNHRWLNGGEVSKLFGGGMTPAQVGQMFHDAHVRAFTDLGVSEAVAADLVALREKEVDDTTYTEGAMAIFAAHKEAPTEAFLASLAQVGQPTNPNTKPDGDPGDIEIELEGTVCVEVQVPPFVKVSVCVKVKVKGKLKDIEALRKALSQVMEQVRKELEEKIRKQLEDLKKLLEDLLKEFRKWLENLDLPWWLRYLSMGNAGGGIVISSV